MSVVMGQPKMPLISSSAIEASRSIVGLLLLSQDLWVGGPTIVILILRHLGIGGEDPYLCKQGERLLMVGLETGVVFCQQ